MADQHTAEEIKNAMENRRGLDPSLLTAEALKQAGCLTTVCVLPEDFKDRISYLGNLLASMTMGNKPDKSERLRSTVGKLCQVLCYMLNSCSWQEQELHDFDYDEIRRKLRSFVR